MILDFDPSDPDFLSKLTAAMVRQLDGEDLTIRVPRRTPTESAASDTPHSG